MDRIAEVAASFVWKCARLPHTGRAPPFVIRSTQLWPMVIRDTCFLPRLSWPWIAPTAIVSPQPPPEDPFAVAARALARRDRGLPDHEQAEFIAWLRADPANAAASARLEEVWRRLDLLRTLCPRSGDTPDQDLLDRPHGTNGP